MAIYTVTVSNIPGDDPATLLQALGVPGTAWLVVGGGSEWPIESGIRIECAITEAQWQDARLNLVKLLGRLGETAAYVTVNGAKAMLVYADGSEEVLA